VVGWQTAGGVGTGGLSEAEGEVVDDDKAVGHTVVVEPVTHATGQSLGRPNSGYQ
jgi:hypothetical protein